MESEQSKNTGTSQSRFNENKEHWAGAAEEIHARFEKLMKEMAWCEICRYPMPKEGECEYCAEQKRLQEVLKEREREREIRRLGGLRAYEDYTYQKLDSKFYDIKAISQLWQSCENLYIWGGRGTGKTHIATVIVRARPYGLIIKPQDMMRILKDKVIEMKEEVKERDFFINHKRLCIDDLGSEKLTAHTQSLLYEIMDGRWQSKNRGLVITSNLSLDELARESDDRIASRIAGMCKVVKLSGEDRRVAN